MAKEKKEFHIKPEDVEKGRKEHETKLTMKQRKAVAEYLRTGNKSASYKSAYNANPKTVSIQANKLFKKPKIINALEKALKESKFDDSYAVSTLKRITDAGMENLDITRPDTALKALDTYFKITNKIGGGNKVTLKMDVESQAKKMDMTELLQGLKELDKKQKHILAIIEGKAPAVEEGEIIK